MTIREHTTDGKSCCTVSRIDLDLLLRFFFPEVVITIFRTLPSGKYAFWFTFTQSRSEKISLLCWKGLCFFVWLFYYLLFSLAKFLFFCNKNKPEVFFQSIMECDIRFLDLKKKNYFQNLYSVKSIILNSWQNFSYIISYYYTVC